MSRTKNRRRERRHVLDVKLSSNQVRRRRTQLVVSALFAVTFLTCTVYGLWRGGWWALQRFVYQNEQLQVRDFQVRTDGVINPEHLRRWAGVKLGDNLFAIDLHGIKHELEMHGMIRQASLERVLPGTLRLQVAERIPLAHVRLRFSGADGRLLTRDFGLDETGRVMPLDRAIVRPETANAWRQLPALTGLAESEILPGNDLTKLEDDAHERLGRAVLENWGVGNYLLNAMVPSTARFKQDAGQTIAFLDERQMNQVTRQIVTNLGKELTERLKK